MLLHVQLSVLAHFMPNDECPVLYLQEFFVAAPTEEGHMKNALLGPVDTAFSLSNNLPYACAHCDIFVRPSRHQLDEHWRVRAGVW